MNLHDQIMDIPIQHTRGEFDKEIHYAHYEEGFKDALTAAAQLSLKADARIDQLENALQQLYLTSGPVANCAYNVGQRHEDWDNIKGYIDKLNSARLVAVSVFKEKK